VVELELLQGGQRPVALFGQLQRPALERTGLGEHVLIGVRLAEERQRDIDDARCGEQRADDQR
jgi:hypothetical protein